MGILKSISNFFGKLFGRKKVEPAKKESYEVEINRDAVTGQFVSDEFVKENPSTTTTETRVVKKKKKKA